MMMLAIVSLLTGALLAQRFKILILIPATVIVLLVAVGTGVVQAHTTWWIMLMAAAASTSMQVGYAIGISIRHVLDAPVAERSFSAARLLGIPRARHPLN
jgi:membrane protein DedA with SNARE-associated domain